MLKTCNSLLRKLSKSCDTEFCGRILLFLATIYPISERSALNVMGKVNVANVTYYEEKEAFEQNLGLAPHAAATSAEGIAVQVRTLFVSVCNNSDSSNSTRRMVRRMARRWRSRACPPTTSTANFGNCR